MGAGGEKKMGGTCARETKRLGIDKGLKGLALFLSEGGLHRLIAFDHRGAFLARRGLREFCLQGVPGHGIVGKKRGA